MILAKYRKRRCNILKASVPWFCCPWDIRHVFTKTIAWFHGLCTPSLVCLLRQYHAWFHDLCTLNFVCLLRQYHAWFCGLCTQNLVFLLRQASSGKARFFWSGVIRYFSLGTFLWFRVFGDWHSHQSKKLLIGCFIFLQVVFDRLKGMALVLYNEIEYAQAAVKETKGRKIGGNKIKVCTVTLTKAKGCVWHMPLIPDRST